MAAPAPAKAHSTMFPTMEVLAAAFTWLGVDREGAAAAGFVTRTAVQILGFRRCNSSRIRKALFALVQTSMSRILTLTHTSAFMKKWSRYSCFCYTNVLVRIFLDYSWIRMCAAKYVWTYWITVENFYELELWLAFRGLFFFFFFYSVDYVIGISNYVQMKLYMDQLLVRNLWKKII